jgi:hypothetical protein
LFDGGTFPDSKGWHSPHGLNRSTFSLEVKENKMIKEYIAGSIFGLIIVGLVALLIAGFMESDRERAKCAGYYNVNYGCAVAR